ncbi:MAG TPA: DUF72 domain-containing protein [Ornithinibacter sp.]|nr:DUF72 domain-containing protein [Ornithinibacter sp.]
MTILVGTSGWTYDSWAGPFYATVPRRRWLEHYATRLPTVELNASHYRWPRDSAFESWRERLPPGFEMAVKAPRALTHAGRLAAPERWAEIIDRGMHLLGDRAGPLLLQLPPTMERDDERLDHALRAIPPWIRVAVELRHGSWLDEAVFAVLERHRAAYVVMSGARLPCVLRATSETVYVRWHGPSHDHLYAGSYPEEDLRWWADRLREWETAGHAVRGYFNNDEHGYAAANAQRLHQLLAQ